MKPYLRISIAYLATGILWILASDHLVALLADTKEGQSWLQTGKGWFFVFASTLLIYGLTRGAFERAQQAEAEKQAVFKKTIEGAHHILLNYLNQMQLVTLEAQNCPGFDPDTLALSQRVSRETADELRSLEGIELGKASDIEAHIYRQLRATREAVEKSALSR